jgi:PhoH-like ATPase
VPARMTTHDGQRLLTAVPMGRAKQTAWGLEPKNTEQMFALNLLLDPDVSIVALSGAAGTGKTILAVAAALEQTFERAPRYKRVTILRPVISVGGQDLGFLPGDVRDKLGPWFENIVDAMVRLSEGLTHKQARERLDAWVEEERLTMEAVTFLRGRSLQDTLVIVDEAQNLEASTIKTILTRLAEGSKAVLTGDVEQIDNPYLSTYDNGLSVLAGAFAGEPQFGQVVLREGRRSAAANLAALRL